jgi:hypothetical protein
MKARTLVKRSAALMLALLICFVVSAVCSGTARLNALAQPGAVPPGALAQSDAAQSGALAQPGATQPDAAQSDVVTTIHPPSESKAKGDASVKPSDAKNQAPHWSVFNLAASLLSLLIALALIARLGILALRDDRLEAEVWERMRTPQTLADMEEAAILRAERDGHPKGSTVFNGQMTALNQLCTSVCVGLALVSIIVFFIVERFDAPLVILDVLSPLFGILLVLTLLGAVFSLLSGRGIFAFEKRGGSEPFDEDEDDSDDKWL